jgi:hypothetical protein
MNIIKPTQIRIIREKYTFFVINKILGAPTKIKKTGRIPYLGLELTMHVIKS